jgi:prolyl-tRNA synthetase
LRYRELSIATQRQAPSNARTPGIAWLNRAGYLSRLGEPTPLGRQAIARLQSLALSPDFFARMALPVIEADEDEKFFAISSGRFEIMQCSFGDYAARREIARFRKRFLLPEEHLALERIPTPDCDTIESLCAYLGVPKSQTSKALMFTRPSDGKFIFVVVRGDMQLSLPKLEALTGPVRLATGQEIAASGAAAGYASPIGLKGALVAIDDVIPDSANLVAGANQAGYHLKNVNYGRDYTAAITADLALASPDDACPNCDGRLISVQAELLGDRSGHRFEAILAALAEVHHDDRGLTLPPAAAPFDVYLMNVPGRELDTGAAAGELDENLHRAGLSVLYDDRDERAGVKFNDADLIGCPVRLVVGEKNLREGMVELKTRNKADSRLCTLPEVITHLQRMIGEAEG